MPRLALFLAKLAALAAALALAGCGDWSDLDVEFLRALPQKEDLTATPPSDGAQALTDDTWGSRGDALLGRSDVPALVVGTATQANAIVTGLTRGIDFIRKLRPTERGDDFRVWGPFNDDQHPGIEVKFTLKKTGAETFSYAIEHRRKGDAEFLTSGTGTFEGDRAVKGKGSFTFDKAIARRLGIADGNDDVEQATITYDLTQGEAHVTIAITNAAGARGDVVYTVRPDRSGEMKFTVGANFVDRTPALETLTVEARWLSDRRGRASTTLQGGDIPSGVVGQQNECWNVRAIQVFRQRNFECGGAMQPACTEGDDGACAIPRW